MDAKKTALQAAATWEAISVERRRLADELERLPASDWTSPTICDEWNVKAVAAHLILPFQVSKPRFALRLIRNRRDVTKTIMQLSAEVDKSTTPVEIVEALRQNAESKWKPPGAGPELPLGEIVVHGQDIRHSLGLPTTVPEETIRLLLAAVSDDVVRADYAARIAGPADPDLGRSST